MCRKSIREYEAHSFCHSVRFRTNDQHEALFKKTEPPFESVGIPSLNQLTDVQTAEVENSVTCLL